MTKAAASPTRMKRKARIRAPLTREERSIVRILLKHGLTRAEIARRVDCSSSTISNIQNGHTAPSDTGNDWDFVNDAFKRNYPPINVIKSEPKESVMLRASDRSISPTVVEEGNNSISSRSAVRLGQPAQVNASASTSTFKVSKKETHPVIPSHAGSSVRANATTSSSTHDMGPLPVPPSHAGSSRQRAILIDIDPESEPEVEEIPDVLPELYNFLAGLEHDLTDIFDALRQQDLGTSEKFFAVAHWPEEDLHRLFREALPQMTVAQRFMLVKGMKKVCKSR